VSERENFVRSKMSEEITYFNFNASKTLLSLGFSSGFCLYKCFPFELLHREGKSYAEIVGFRVVEIHENTQLLGLVGATEEPCFTPRRLTIWNIEKRLVICETSFPEQILKVNFNNLSIVAVTASCIYIYSINTLQAQHSIRTCHNPKGLSALSPQSTCILLYPSSNETGQICIYDCFIMKSCAEVDAHRSSLAALAISYNGTLAATASQKGTVIRVFSLPKGSKLYSFKRGMSYVDVWDLSFAPTLPLLMLCSSSGTVHIFRLEGEQHNGFKLSSFLQYNISRTMSLMLPEAYSDSVESKKSYLRINTASEGPFKAALEEATSQVLVVTKNGDFKVYEVDLIGGGTGRLVREGSLL